MGIGTLKQTIIAGAAVVAITMGGGEARAADTDSDLYIEPEMKEYQRSPGVPEDAADLFDLLDDNDDGVIDSGEWRSQKMFVFYARDVDQDYQLTREEIPGIADSIFEAADTNNDGLMSGFEFNQAEFTQFNSVDPDVNQAVNYDEFLLFVFRIETGEPIKTGAQ